MHADICLKKSQHAGIPQPASHSQKIVSRFKHRAYRLQLWRDHAQLFCGGGRTRNIKKTKKTRSLRSSVLTYSMTFPLYFILSFYQILLRQRDTKRYAPNCKVPELLTRVSGAEHRARTASHLHPLHTLTGDGGYACCSGGDAVTKRSGWISCRVENNMDIYGYGEDSDILKA